MFRYTLSLEHGVIGVISDTHGLLRPEAVAALQGSALIIHAGDIGTPAVLQALEMLAPVVAVRGNNDTGPWAEALPDRAVVELGSHALYVLHDVKTLGRHPQVTGYSAVIAGHSHRPALVERHGVLFVNPGSAGPRRFTLPVAVARLHIHAVTLRAELVTLDVARSRPSPA
jgi:putative phosphoesterase